MSHDERDQPGVPPGADPHPDEGMEEFQRSGAEEDDLEQVGEDEGPPTDEPGPTATTPLPGALEEE